MTFHSSVTVFPMATADVVIIGAGIIGSSIAMK
jgi:glycerol-3-phosphate dehydrogenase